MFDIMQFASSMVVIPSDRHSCGVEAKVKSHSSFPHSHSSRKG